MSSKTSPRKVRDRSIVDGGRNFDTNGRIDWAEEDTELPSGNLHLWEESWDDDEQNDDFSKQLKCVHHAKVLGMRS
jgi:26 proteasome complex subunit DSS1